MKKIVFCSPSLIMGGAEKVLVACINLLGKTGKYDIRLVNYQKSDKMFLYSQIDVPFKYLYFDATKEKPNNFILRKIWRIRRHRFIKKAFRDADIAIDWLDGGFYRFVSEFKGKRIGWIHSAYPHFKENIKKDFSCYDALVCLSDSFKEDLEQDEPNMKGKVHRIYNPFNLDNIQKLSEEFDTFPQSDQDLLKGSFYVHLSRIAVDKDIATLIRGYKKFVEKTKTTDKLYIIGTGDLFAHYQEMVQKEKMQDFILMLGQKNNPYPFIKGAKALILSSLLEGLPNVIIEAMICKTPVIAANCKSGIKELCLNGEGGFLFTPGDADSLSETLETFCQHPEIAAQHVENAYHALDRFKVENIQPQIERLLDE